MNSAAHLSHPRIAHARVFAGDWEDFGRPRQRREPTARGPRTKARVAHAQVSFAGTPELYLREEMG